MNVIEFPNLDGNTTPLPHEVEEFIRKISNGGSIATVISDASFWRCLHNTFRPRVPVSEFNIYTVRDPLEISELTSIENSDGNKLYLRVGKDGQTSIRVTCLPRIQNSVQILAKCLSKIACIKQYSLCWDPINNWVVDPLNVVPSLQDQKLSLMDTITANTERNYIVPLRALRIWAQLNDIGMELDSKAISFITGNDANTVKADPQILRSEMERVLRSREIKLCIELMVKTELWKHLFSDTNPTRSSIFDETCRRIQSLENDSRKMIHTNRIRRWELLFRLISQAERKKAVKRFSLGQYNLLEPRNEMRGLYKLPFYIG